MKVGRGEADVEDLGLAFPGELLALQEAGKVGGGLPHPLEGGGDYSSPR